MITLPINDDHLSCCYILMTVDCTLPVVMSCVKSRFLRGMFLIDS